jgi:hypothetical protein
METKRHDTTLGVGASTDGRKKYTTTTHREERPAGSFIRIYMLPERE